VPSDPLRRVELSPQCANVLDVHVSISPGVFWNLGRRIFMGRLDVRVRVHEATLTESYQAEAFFINVTSSPGRSIRPTHVTVLTEPAVVVVNPQPPMRVIAKDGDTWETWVEKSMLPDPSQDIRPSFRSGCRLAS
jgi:hypothetical protein